MPLVALLDANVLWPFVLRDTLVRADIARLYEAIWTRAILDEVARTLKRQRPDLDPARIDRTCALLIEHFPHALVEDYQDLIPAMRNDEGDRHVLAAAVKGRANVLVTVNRRHFPAYACEPHGIDVQTPDQFLCFLWHVDPEQMSAVLLDQAAGLSRPAMTPSQLVIAPGRHAPDFARTVLASRMLDEYRH